MDDVHEKFVKYGSNAKAWMRKCELLLPEIARREIWRKKRFGSIYEYAAKLAGMNREKVNECLRIYGHIEDKPELLEVAEKKGLGAVRPVVTVATQEDAGFWAEKVEDMSKHALEVYVKDRRPGTASQPEKITISMGLDPEIARKLQKIKGDKDWNELMEQFLNPQEKPEPIETESRHIPEKIKKYIRQRSGDYCEYDGCGRKAEIFHHTERFALNKCHDPDKIYHLCKGHEQLAHLGLLDEPPNTWKTRSEPDKSDSKYEIDQLVAKYRFPG
ncbi:hypothetical protein KJ764_03055 [Patescibacteria group bacterium]|nr:hypothetical protein [Patescibacteria group bacterium]